MTEQTERTEAQPGAVPARIELEDFVEAVTRGVMRALAAQDDVGGYWLRRTEQEQPAISELLKGTTATIGLWFGTTASQVGVGELGATQHPMA